MDTCSKIMTSNIKAYVWFDLEIIIKVITFEITESPTSDGGYGLRLIVYGGGRYQTEIGQTPQK